MGRKVLTDLKPGDRPRRNTVKGTRNHPKEHVNIINSRRGTARASKHITKTPRNVKEEVPDYSDYESDGSLQFNKRNKQSIFKNSSEEFGYDDDYMSGMDPEEDFNDRKHPLKHSTENNLSTSAQSDAMNTSFSISKHLDSRQSYNEAIENLKKEVEAGNVIGIGKILIENITRQTLSEVQLEEICRNMSAPQVSLTSYVNDVMKADLDNMKCLFIGQEFISRMDKTVTTSLNKMEASIHSLSTTFRKQHHIEAKKKKHLDAIHIIPHIPPFPATNLNEIYNTSALIGDKSVNQLTNLFVTIFRALFPDEYDIWVWSFRPTCPRTADRHFKLIPKQLYLSMCDFGFDVLDNYLPAHVLTGQIDLNDPFVQSLKENSVATIEYRRKVRSSVQEIIDSSIALALQTLRNYHFDMEMRKLIYCGVSSMRRN